MTNVFVKKVLKICFIKHIAISLLISITSKIKTNIYKMVLEKLNEDQLETASSMLKAMAHPMRMAILNYLDGGKRMTVTEIHELLEIEQSTASHHLGILRDKGVLSAKRDGKNTFYFIKDKNINEFVTSLTKCFIK